MFDDEEVKTLIAALRLAWLHTYDEMEWQSYRLLEDKLRRRLKTDYSAEAWIDEENSVNLKLHFRHGDFPAAREALTKFRDIIQERIDLQRNCPFFED